MESQPQNPEFRINPENFHSCRFNAKYAHYQQSFYKAKKIKCLVSGYPTDPNILGPTQTFL